MRIGDSHHEEEAGIDENYTHQNDSVNIDGNLNGRQQIRTGRNSIYEGLKQLSLVMDQQYDGQISLSDYWKQFPPEIAEKATKKHRFYKLIHGFSGFHKKVYNEDITKTVDFLVRHDAAAGDQTWVEPIIVYLLAVKSLSIAGDSK